MAALPMKRQYETPAFERSWEKNAQSGNAASSVRAKRTVVVQCPFVCPCDHVINLPSDHRVEGRAFSHVDFFTVFD